MGLQDNLNQDHKLPSFNAVMFDDAAFEVFFKKHFTSLCAYCQYKYDLDIDLAKDTVHTGFIRLWENRQTISPELSIKAYIYKIISNLCLDIVKREKIKSDYVRYVHEKSPENATANDYNGVDFKQLTDDVEMALSELPEQMRKIFEMSRYEELKYAEIAHQLGISIKTVETQMSRALAKLRVKLSNYLVSLVFLLCFLRSFHF